MLLAVQGSQTGAAYSKCGLICVVYNSKSSSSACISNSFAVVHVSVAYLLSTRAALRKLLILFLYVALGDLVHCLNSAVHHASNSIASYPGRTSLVPRPFHVSARKREILCG